MTQILTPPRALTPDAADRDLPVRPARPRWGRWTQLGVTALAAALYLSNLSVNGLGNPYYAAAVKSGSVSWKAFFFGSLDAGSFITVDKPPAAFWVQAISVRLFGYSSWSILVPEAIAGALAVAVTYHLARRFAGEVAGILAGLALAVTPMAAVMFRFNDPDALMTFLIVLSAWAVWVAVERASIRHLVLGALVLGVAFDAKMLEAFVVLPGLALVWILCAPTSWRRRLWGWLWSGLALVFSAGWWVAIVELWPKDSRPYIASTTDNSLFTLIFGYNGLSRLFGAHGRGSGGGAIGFGGGAGWTRVFGDTLGSQVSWMVPLAALGLVGGLVLAGRRPLTDRGRAGFVLWGGWAVVAFVVFSKSSGTFHPYYTVAMAPAIAVLAGAGAVALWDLARIHRSMAWMLPAGVAGSAVWAYALLHRDPGYHPWLRVAILVAGALGALGLLLALRALPRERGLVALPRERVATPAGRGPPAGAGPATLTPASPARRALTAVSASVAALALLAGPLAWSLSTLTHGSNGTNPTAGPASAATGGFGGGRFSGFGAGGTPGPTAGDRQLVKFLEANRAGAKYIVATDGSMSADDLIIASGKPVMAMGGFSGGDPAPTLAQWEKLVSEGQVRYVLVGGGGFGGFGGGGGFRGGGFGGGGRFSAGEAGEAGPVSSAAPGAPEPVPGETGAFPGAGSGDGRGGAAFGFGGGRGGGTVALVEEWVEAHGTVVPASDYGRGVSGTLYEVTPATVTSAGG